MLLSLKNVILLTDMLHKGNTTMEVALSKQMHVLFVRTSKLHSKDKIHPAQSQSMRPLPCCPTHVSARMKVSWSSTGHTHPVLLYPPCICPFSHPALPAWPRYTFLKTVTQPLALTPLQAHRKAPRSAVQGHTNVGTKMIKTTRIIIFLPLLM